MYKLFKKRNLLIWLLSVTFVFGTLFFLSACGRNKENTDNVTPQTDKKMIDLRLGYTPAINQLGVLAAADRGLFEKYGLNVTYKTFPSGIEIINALQSNEIDIGVMGFPPFLSAASKGVPVAVISAQYGKAEVEEYNTDHFIVARKDSGISATNLDSLYSKKIATVVGAVPELYLRGVMEKAGKDPSKLTIVNMKGQDAVSALASGAVDAIAYWETVCAMALKKAPGSYIVVQGQSNFKDAGVLTSTKNYAEKNGEAIKRFLTALAESQQWIRKHNDEATDIAVRWIQGLDKDVALNAINAVSFDCRVSKNFVDAARQNMEMLEKQGKINKFNLDDYLILKYNLEVQKEHPELFSDLPPIPKDKQF